MKTIINPPDQSDQDFKKNGRVAAARGTRSRLGFRPVLPLFFLGLVTIGLPSIFFPDGRSGLAAASAFSPYGRLRISRIIPGGRLDYYYPGLLPRGSQLQVFQNGKLRDYRFSREENSAGGTGLTEARASDDYKNSGPPVQFIELRLLAASGRVLHSDAVLIDFRPQLLPTKKWNKVCDLLTISPAWDLSRIPGWQDWEELTAGRRGEVCRKNQVSVRRRSALRHPRYGEVNRGKFGLTREKYSTTNHRGHWAWQEVANGNNMTLAEAKTLGQRPIRGGLNMAGQLIFSGPGSAGDRRLALRDNRGRGLGRFLFYIHCPSTESTCRYRSTRALPFLRRRWNIWLELPGAGRSRTRAVFIIQRRKR